MRLRSPVVRQQSQRLPLRHEEAGIRPPGHMRHQPPVERQQRERQQGEPPKKRRKDEKEGTDI